MPAAATTTRATNPPAIGKTGKARGFNDSGVVAVLVGREVVWVMLVVGVTTLDTAVVTG